MGMFDTVLITCPTCGHIIYAQSKSGDCMLEDYYFDEAPASVLAGIYQEECTLCNTVVRVEPVTKPTFKLVVVKESE